MQQHHTVFYMPLRCFIFLLAVFVLIAGCESAPKTGGRLEGALQHYDSQRYNLAHQEAVEALRSTGVSAQEREQAAYVAGMSAFRMGDMDEAELRFNAVLSTSDRAMLGSAQAMMGQIRLEQNRASEAAVFFERAQLSLAGEDARQARRYAAMAKYESGDITAMQRWYDEAGRAGSTGATSTSGFTLQVGAFQDRRRAEQAATDVTESTRRFGYGRVHIRQSADSRGRTLYLVQLGQFPTRQAATSARATIGRLDYIVTALPRS